MASLAELQRTDCVDGAADNPFLCDVLMGLSYDQKAIPARWFYDRRGSELFEQITKLPEYYPTRTEAGILRDCCPDLLRLIGKGRAVVEFGAGSAAKTPILLDCIEPGFYVPVDISGEFLRESCRDLSKRYPDLPIVPVEADFTHPIELPAAIACEAKLGFFPGSTIGNMEPEPAVDLLRAMRDTLGQGSMLLIGMDRIKAQHVLEAAYDDAEGVTAEFNLNLVHRINRELEGEIPSEKLMHRAVWNREKARIEMHLEAARDIGFTVAGHQFFMRRGETIHTENSHKYDPRSADIMLRASRWEPVEFYGDEDDQFMVILARAMKQVVTA